MLFPACPQCTSGLLRAYTEQVLAFNLAGPDLPALKSCREQENAEFISRVGRLAEKSNAEAVILIGLGRGGITAGLQAALPDAPLLVCEPTPQRLRDARNDGLFSAHVDSEHGSQGDAERPGRLFSVRRPGAVQNGFAVQFFKQPDCAVCG